MTLAEILDQYLAKTRRYRIDQRTCIYLANKSTGDPVEIVVEDLDVKAEPVKEKTSGDQ